MRASFMLAAALALIPVVAHARPRKKRAGNASTEPVGKSPPACGVNMLPLVEGNSWTYEATAAPTPPSDQIKRLSPIQPTTVMITVKSIESAKGADTVATLEEKITVDMSRDSAKPKLEERTYTTTITCTDKKFDVSPDSFFFAGEPGGYLGLEITKLDRVKGTSLMLTKGSIGEAEWRDDLVLEWSRRPTEGSGAKLGSGKLELERQITPQPIEPVTTKRGMFRAEKLGLVTTGRVTLDHASPGLRPMELPANWISQLWLAEGVGVVQTLNSFSHMYQLTDVTLK